MSAEAERQTKSQTAPSRWSVVAQLVFAVVFWVLAAVKGSDIAYYFAVAATVGLAFDCTRRWLHAKGAPEWTANEAYIGRLLRWHRSRTKA